MIHIALARVEDLPAATALVVSQLEEHAIAAEPDAIARALERVIMIPDLGFLLVAHLEKKSVGVAYVSFVWSLEHGGRAAWLEELYVSLEFRERGVGRELVRAVLERARALGCGAVDLEVEHAHRQAENLYLREGFAPLSRTRYVRHLEDERPVSRRDA